MKINLKRRVEKCSNIGNSVRRYLLMKTMDKKPSFMPFEVQRVAIQPKKVTLAEYKQSVLAVYSDRKAQQPRYDKSSRRSTKGNVTNMFQSQAEWHQPSINKHEDQTFFHSFYAKQVMKEKRAMTADTTLKNKRKIKLSNLCNQPQKQRHTYTADAAFGKTTGEFGKYNILQLPLHYPHKVTVSSLNNKIFTNGQRHNRKHRSIDRTRGQDMTFELNPSTNLFEFKYAKKTGDN